MKNSEMILDKLYSVQVSNNEYVNNTYIKIDGKGNPLDEHGNSINKEELMGDSSLTADAYVGSEIYGYIQDPSNESDVLEQRLSYNKETGQFYYIVGTERVNYTLAYKDYDASNSLSKIGNLFTKESDTLVRLLHTTFTNTETYAGYVKGNRVGGENTPIGLTSVCYPFASFAGWSFTGDTDLEIKDVTTTEKELDSTSDTNETLYIYDFIGDINPYLTTPETKVDAIKQVTCIK